MKIVWNEFSGLGNAVLSTPALQAIKKVHPNCELIVSTWPRSARAYQGLSFIDKVEIDHPTNVLARNSIVDYVLISPVGAITTPEMARFAKEFITNPVKPPYIKHESEYKMDLARQLEYVGDTPLPQFALFDTNFYMAKGFIKENQLEPKKFICMNASYLRTDHWHLKHWGNDNYARLLYDFQYKYPDYKVVLLGTKQDKDDAAYIRFVPSFLSKYPYCEGKTKIACGWSEDVGDTAALMSLSLGLVGNDSGLAHVAAALELPTVTIFTFTNTVKNSPLGQKSNIIASFCDKRLSCQHGNWKECQERSCMKVSPIQVLTQIAQNIPLS